MHTLSLLPATSLQTAVGVDEEETVREDVEHGLEAVTNLLVAGDTRRVDVVNTRTDLVGVAVLLEGVQELHVALRCLDGDDISVEALNGGEDVVEVGVAEVRVGLESIGNASSRELEGIDSPLEVAVPVRATKGETFTNSGLVDLDGGDTGLLEINDLVAEGKGKLLGLELARDIRTRERPVQDSDRPSEHTLHGALGNALGVRTPLDSDGPGTADVGDDDGRTDVTIKSN